MIDLPTRRHLLAGSASLAAGAASAQITDFPTRSLRMLVPFPPAGAADVLARIVAEAVRPTLGQTVVVENRTGGGGSIGTEAAIRAPADGYTIMMGNQSTHAINPETRRLPYDPARQLAPLAMIGNLAYVLYVRPGLPARTLAEMIALAKAQPGRLTYGSAGIGAGTHLAMLLLEYLAGIELTHVPYQGTAPATAAVLAGQIDMMLDTVPTGLPHINGRSVFPLAVTSKTRHDLLPDVPAVAELGFPDYEAVLFYGLFAPAGVPDAIQTRLVDSFTATIAQPAIRARLAEIGADPLPVPRAEMPAYIAADRARWGEVIRRAGLRAE